MTLKVKKTCVITGATGFIGRHLIEKLYSKYKIIGIGRRNTSPSDLIDTWIQFDFAKDNIEKIFISDKIDVFFHLAANTNDNKALWEFEDRYLSDIVNPILLINYLSSNIKKVVFFSSISTYETKGIYSCNKLNFEYALKLLTNKTNIKASVLRISSVYGPGMPEKSAIISFLRKIKKNEEPVIMSDDSVKRNYVYIDDVINSTIEISEKDQEDVFEIYNIISNESINLSTLMNEVKKAVLGKEEYSKNKTNANLENEYSYLKKLKPTICKNTKYSSLNLGLKELIKCLY